MKQINNYIQEKLKLNKAVINKNQCTLFPKTRNELTEMIQREIEKNGKNCSLNHIDVSNITSMGYLFSNLNKLEHFNGDISEWDVSNVTDMYKMFMRSDFDGNISNWDVSNVENMYAMFYSARFNGDISKWKINPECNTWQMFVNCPIKNEYKPKFLQD